VRRSISPVAFAGTRAKRSAIDALGLALMAKTQAMPAKRSAIDALGLGLMAKG